MTMTRWRGRTAALAVVLLAVLAGGAIARPWETSPLLRTVALGTVPWQVVLDQRTGRAFVVTANRTANTVSMLDTATGALLRTFAVGGALWFQSTAMSSPLWSEQIAGADERTQRVFIAVQGQDGQGKVSVLDARSGAVLGTISLGPRLPGAVAIVVDDRAQRIFVSGQGVDGQGKLSVLDARSGILLRTIPLSIVPWSMALDGQTWRIFARSLQGEVVMLDAQTGALLRAVSLAATGRQVVANVRTARVFVSDTGRGTVSVLDAHSGRLLRTVVLPLGVGSATVDEETTHVFVTAPTRASVTVLDGRSGAILRTVAVGVHPSAVAVDGQTGTVLVSALGPLDSAGHVTSYGSVSVLDGRTFAVQRALPVGVAPLDMAVDGRTRHALVVNSNYNPLDCSLAYVPMPEGWWTQGVRWLTHRLSWLPIASPQPPSPSTNGSLTLLDNTRI